MKKDPKVYLLHIAEAIDAIEHNIQSLTEQQFYGNEVV